MKWLFTLLLLAVPAAACGQTVAELRTHVDYLADDSLAGRLPASEGMEQAIVYVKAECKKLGLQTYAQPVTVRGGTCNNTVAVLPGLRDDIRIVIGAHLDHIGSKKWGKQDIIYNGADDNASGCAMVLAMARKIVAQGKPACTVEFHWYTGEEQGLLGSKTYCKKPIGDISEYQFMINLDMVGRLGDKLKGDPEGADGSEVTTLITLPEAKRFEPVLEDLYERYEFAKRITWFRNTNDSDHASWWLAGVPAVILHTGIHKDYHQGGDEADRIDYQGMVDITKYALDIYRGAQEELCPGGPSVVVPEPYIIR